MAFGEKSNAVLIRPEQVRHGPDRDLSCRHRGMEKEQPSRLPSVQGTKRVLQRPTAGPCPRARSLHGVQDWDVRMLSEESASPEELVPACLRPRGRRETMTDFTFRRILLAIPGLFAASLYDALNGRRDRSPSSLFLAVVLFSNGAYLLFSLLQILCPGITGGQGEPVFSSLFAETPGIQPGTLLQVTLCGVLLALAMTYANTDSLMHRLANYIKATYRSGIRMSGTSSTTWTSKGRSGISSETTSTT